MELPHYSPPWTVVGRRIESMIRKAIYDFEMLPLGTSKVCVALSGGKDSLALLLMLKAICGHGVPAFDITAIHVSGEFSCGAGVNTNYLKEICDKLEIPLLIKESNQKLETLQCYSCSRERRKLLFEAAKSVGSDIIAFGHHKDDSVQTLLMNLLHKAEFEGNLPKIRMHKFGITLLRPLIYVAEEEIRAFAKQQGFLRIMCRCPVGQNSMRKQVAKLLEEISTLFPNAPENIAQAALRYQSGKAGYDFDP